MKTKLAILAFLLWLLCFYTATAFAQSDSGGGSECPVSYSVKKNNGGGKCQGDALVTVVFNPMPLPGNIPRLTAIFYKGQFLGSMVPAEGYLVAKAGETNVTYCLTEPGPKTNPFNNISAAGKLILEFTYQNGTVCRTRTPN